MKLVSIENAKDLLLNGEVVAVPTETVYGLAGWIYSEQGLKKIFSTKERPFFDPLIVHIDSVEKAKILTSNWTKVHELLAQACWPGPLTLIAKKNDKINPLITAGLDSVGLRCPRHPETLKLLSLIDGGLAAPSANKFGKTSPTTSFHVAQEFEDQVSILEGGPCEIGIESTVVGVHESSDKFTIEIYRPGFYTASHFKDILKDCGLVIEVKYAESPVAPGQLKHHYMPKIPLVIIPEGMTWENKREEIESRLGQKFLKPAIWDQPNDPLLASRELYQKLREFDEHGHDIILTSKKSFHDNENWFGVWNRLEKAKTLRL
ncbi:MAG: L-threonylcarbamoyladenylate synthase [Bacteriovoracaceae bacterium]